MSDYYFFFLSKGGSLNYFTFMYLSIFAIRFVFVSLHNSVQLSVSPSEVFLLCVPTNESTQNKTNKKKLFRLEHHATGASVQLSALEKSSQTLPLASTVIQNTGCNGTFY